MARSDGDARFHLLVSRDGSTVVDDGTHIYGPWFAVYAHAKFGAVFNNSLALERARATFAAVDDAAFDAVRGIYGEDGSVPTLHGVVLPNGRMPLTLNAVLHGIGACFFVFPAFQA